MKRCIGWSFLFASLCLAGTLPASAQSGMEARGSRNVAMLGHVAVDQAATVEVDQEPDRPYAYLATEAGGFVVIDLEAPSDPKILHTWVPEGSATEPGAGDLVAFKQADRHYLVRAVAAADPGAIVFDVTGLPDGSSVTEVARLREASAPTGFHALFAYKHSDGRALLLATGGGAVYVYDLAQVLAGGAGLVAQLDTPEQLQASSAGFEDVFAGFEPDAGQDRLYGAGAGGYYVFDITDPAGATLLATISSAAVQRGHAIAPTPDGRYAVTAAGYRTAPLRIFDLKPGLDGTLPRIRTAVSAWMADWRNDYAALEVRWPYVFVAALEDGVQVFNMRDPAAPYTVAYYRTGNAPAAMPANPTTPPSGTISLDVRNADGLIVASDMNTGLWVFTLEAFSGWHGHHWGVPNMSSAQDWDNGPDGK